MKITPRLIIAASVAVASVARLVAAVQAQQKPPAPAANLLAKRIRK